MMRLAVGRGAQALRRPSQMRPLFTRSFAQQFPVSKQTDDTRGKGGELHPKLGGFHIPRDKGKSPEPTTNTNFAKTPSVDTSTAATASTAVEEQTGSTENSMLRTNSHFYDKQTYMIPMVNHIWSEEEIRARLEKPQPVHVPKTWADKFMYHLVKTVLYRGFNFVTGFDYKDPTPRSCAYRLIILESIAGVPGMVAGVLRHFHSLRTLRRDHGWIHTLIEEAQNERMHLLVCMKMFDAGILTRTACALGQIGIVTFLTATYMVHPKALHRFVGYLEETAVLTYTDLVRLTRTPGTKLHKAWDGLPAPPLAKAYWNLRDDAEWVHVLENLLADETHHRDVNHCFADMDQDEANPFVDRHMQDFAQQRDLTFTPK
ncbi:unnamed protein product [Amoebophrya sp. A120]|nr:unnamed protein product [Amoebophrya sp. A120]|eukprot:GSA120T00021690001.1